MVKITTLIENKLETISGLNAEHGLSFYIEADHQKILFDTGQSGDFINNAHLLKIDLNQLDYVVLSHGHYDHSGGFKKLVEKFPTSYKLLIGSGFLNEKYKMVEDGSYMFNGNSFGQEFLNENNINTKVISKNITYITENIMIFTNFIKDKQYENPNKTMFIKKDHTYKPDTFTDEIAMGINTPKGLIVIVGCAHVGIVNMLNTIEQRTGFSIYALIGGTHLRDSDSQQISKFIDLLEQKEVEIIGVSHCTGEKAEKTIKERLPNNFSSNHTGGHYQFT